VILPGIKIPWQVFACAGVMVVLGVVGWKLYDLGRDHNEKSWQTKVEKGKAIVDELKKKQGSITISGEVRYVEKVKIIKEKGDVIEKRIPIYIPVDSDLPAGFRVLYDSAALGTIPGAPEDGSPVSVRDVASTTSRNFAICHQWKTALDEQVLWGRQQRELYLSECKRQGLSCN
jgi:hypothetical protein